MKNEKAPALPSIGQLWAEIKSLKARLDEIRTIVNKLRDILQVQDNWHSRTAKWIGKTVELIVDGPPINGSLNNHTYEGILLWTDRYNIGVNILGVEKIFNKGHIIWIYAPGE